MSQCPTQAEMLYLIDILPKVGLINIFISNSNWFHNITVGLLSVLMQTFPGICFQQQKTSVKPTDLYLPGNKQQN